MTAALTFAVGLTALLAAAKLIVRAASDLGAALGLGPMVVGLTIVAVGTSTPELAVVGQAVAADDTALAVGSVIGSNVANILLVLGLAACMGTMHVASRVVRFDVPVMLAASVALILFALDGTVGRIDGIALLAGLAAFVTWTIVQTRRETEVDQHSPGTDHPPKHWSPAIALAAFAVGVAAVGGAARVVVAGAEGVAAALGVPELIVGLTIVALGTSAPEIVTTLVAARAGNHDLAVGNAVGSNIFNIMLVLGSIGAITPSGLAISEDALRLDLPVMAAAALACLPVLAWDHALRRWEGALFVSYYAAYLLFLVLDATGHRAAHPFAVVMGAFVVPLSIVTLSTVAIRRRATRRRIARHCAPTPW